MITPTQRAITLRAALEAHYEVSLPGAEWMIEATINAALGQAPFAASIGSGRLRMCPVSERPCGMPTICEANENGCVITAMHAPADRPSRRGRRARIHPR